MASQLGMPGRSGLFPGKVHRDGDPGDTGKLPKKPSKQPGCLFMDGNFGKISLPRDPCKDFFWDVHEKLKEPFISVVLSGSFGRRFFFVIPMSLLHQWAHGLNRQAIVCFF